MPIRLISDVFVSAVIGLVALPPVETIRVEGDLDAAAFADEIVAEFDNGSPVAPVRVTFAIDAAREDLVFDVAEAIRRSSATVHVFLAPGADGEIEPASILFALLADRAGIDSVGLIAEDERSLRHLAPDETPWRLVELDLRRLAEQGLFQRKQAALAAELIVPTQSVWALPDGSLSSDPGGARPLVVPSVEGFVVRARGADMASFMGFDATTGPNTWFDVPRSHRARILRSGLSSAIADANRLFGAAWISLESIGERLAARSVRGDDTRFINSRLASVTSDLAVIAGLRARFPEVDRTPPPSGPSGRAKSWQAAVRGLEREHDRLRARVADR